MVWYFQRGFASNCCSIDLPRVSLGRAQENSARAFKTPFGYPSVRGSTYERACVVGCSFLGRGEVYRNGVAQRVKPFRKKGY